MYTTTVRIPDIDTAKNFVNVAGKYASIGMHLKSENYIIDAHSIVGILSLDLSKPILLATDDNFPPEFLQDIAAFEDKN